MSNRFNQEREALLQPVRIKTCKAELEKMCYTVELNEVDKCLTFNIELPDYEKPVTMRLYPYSGWWSAKHIGSGRGFRNMLKAIKRAQESVL